MGVVISSAATSVKLGVNITITVTTRAVMHYK